MRTTPITKHTARNLKPQQDRNPIERLLCNTLTSRCSYCNSWKWPMTTMGRNICPMISGRIITSNIILLLMLPWKLLEPWPENSFSWKKSHQIPLNLSNSLDLSNTLWIFGSVEMHCRIFESIYAKISACVKPSGDSLNVQRSLFRTVEKAIPENWSVSSCRWHQPELTLCRFAQDQWSMRNDIDINHGPMWLISISLGEILLP